MTELQGSGPPAFVRLGAAEYIWTTMRNTEAAEVVFLAVAENLAAALDEADVQLTRIADETDEATGTDIDSVRALLKDALAEYRALVPAKTTEETG